MAGALATNSIWLIRLGPFHGQLTASTLTWSESGTSSAARSSVPMPPRITTVQSTIRGAARRFPMSRVVRGRQIPLTVSRCEPIMRQRSKPRPSEGAGTRSSLTGVLGRARDSACEAGDIAHAGRGAKGKAIRMAASVTAARWARDDGQVRRTVLTQ